MNSATERIRALLDERGVEYMKVDFLDGEHITSFDVNGREYGYHEFPDGGTLLRVWHPSPEQAIAATLGTGTCHEVMINRHWRGCGECGYVWENMYGEGFQKGPNYCPMCGRRIEQ